VPEKSAGATDIHEADVAQFFQVMRKRGSGNTQFFLKFTSHHAGGVSGEEQADDAQAGFGTEGGKAIGGAGDEKGIRLWHISTIAEIQFKRNQFLSSWFTSARGPPRMLLRFAARLPLAEF
jgi:hypothetical protein